MADREPEETNGHHLLLRPTSLYPEALAFVLVCPIAQNARWRTNSRAVAGLSSEDPVWREPGCDGCSPEPSPVSVRVLYVLQVVTKAYLCSRHLVRLGVVVDETQTMAETPEGLGRCVGCFTVCVCLVEVAELREEDEVQDKRSKQGIQADRSVLVSFKGDP